jgi:hypothetical protein
MRSSGPLIVAAVAVMLMQILSAQRMTPTAPGTAGDPVWQGIVRLSDGRTFLTDGGLAVDTAFAKPATLPAREIPGKVLETYLNAERKNEYGLSDLTPAATGKTFTTPSGIPLNATYISYLRRTLPSGVRFRVGGELEPIGIVVDGKVVGVLMPVRK